MSGRLTDECKKSETSPKKRQIENGRNLPNSLTITTKKGGITFAPMMVGNNVTGDVKLHVVTGEERNSDAASSPQDKELQADSTDQRDEDMEMGD